MKLDVRHAFQFGVEPQWLVFRCMLNEGVIDGAAPECKVLLHLVAGHEQGRAHGVEGA